MEMPGKSKLKKISIAIIILICIAIFFVIIFKGSNNTEIITDPSILRAMTYTEYTDDDGHKEVYELDSTTGEETENVIDNVEFSAFFLQDLDSDGYAESIAGTCNEIGSSATLYMELNVLTEGYLTDATITINGQNFYLSTSLPEDNQYLSNYISSNTDSISFKDLTAGTQKLISGNVRSGDKLTSKKSDAIGSNINNYSRDDNTIVLTGTYVDGSGNETEIYKKVNLTVDWYGTTTSKVYTQKSGSTGTTSKTYEDIESRINEEEDTFIAEFTIYTTETDYELILEKNISTAVIPQLNGYDPASVTVTTKNVEYEYDEETRLLTITKNSTVDETTGKVTSTLARENTYTINVVYPLDAYKKIDEEAITIKIPVTTYYTGYNNDSGEFDNPYTSNVAKATLVITYRNPIGTVADIDIKVGKYVTSPTYRYIVSKEKPLNIYNGVSDEETDDTYLVRWELSTGTDGNTNGAVLEEYTSSYTEDQFITSDGTCESMANVTTNIGIYFGNATKMVGSDGYIYVYNADTDELIVTFTSDGTGNTKNWNNYSSTNPYYYTESVDHIRIETSETTVSTYMYVYNIKELDDDYITSNYTLEEFENLSYIYSSLKGSIGENSLGYDYAEAYYEAPYTVATISLSEGSISTQITTENEIITISALEDSNSNQLGWLNGSFLVVLPSGILEMDINDVTISNTNVEILSYEITEIDENGTTYKAIKINTNNLTEEEQSYTIKIDCDITPDPRIASTNGTVKLYASNEETSYYYYNATDVYDVNDNLNTTETVNYRTATLSLIAPNSLITNETVSEFDDKDEEVVSPQTAEISPLEVNVDTEKSTAKIGVNLLNNYSSTVSDIIVLGRIPFEGNNYVISGANLGSTFSTTLTGPIEVPEELEGAVAVYYSANGSATKDLEDESNEWLAEDEVEDWSNVLSYLIDFEETILDSKEEYTFYYTVQIPSGVEYNEISYSHHGVYFCLDTDDGKYVTRTEPTKVGLMIAEKYDLELTKYQLNTDYLVSGATYKVTEVELDEDGNVTEEITSKTATTSENGILTISDLYAERTYTIQEIKSPVNYELSSNVIKFICHIDDDGIATIEVLDGEVKGEFTISNTDDGYVASVNVEDEVKAKIKIVKLNEDNESLSGIKFKLTGKNYTVGKVLTTNSNGEVTLSGLSIGETYTIQETKTLSGYYLIQEPITFTVENNDGNYEINVVSDSENSVSLGDTIFEDGIPTVELNIENKLIPTYSIEILKIEDNDEEQTGLANARFELYSEDTESYTYLNTDEEGKLTFEGAYNYVDGKYITGKYTLTEIIAPDGYVVSGETIEFYVELNSNGTYTMNVTNESDLYSLVSYDDTETEKVSFVIQNSPQFKITKISAEDGTKQAGVKFYIQEVDALGSALGYAKDTQGNYIGEKNSKGQYIITTDENGEYTVALAGGFYKLVEVEALEGYELAEDVYFTVAGYADLEIDSIEDLVAFATDGDTYSDKTVELTRDLDFNDEDSYEDPENMGKLTYTPKEEFDGTFLGKGYTISNLTIDTTTSSSSYIGAGLFAYAYKATITNLTLEDLTINIEDENGSTLYIGGIVGYAGSKIDLQNCNINNNEITSIISIENESGTSYVGGLVGALENKNISHCSNSATINVTSNISYCGGILGSRVEQNSYSYSYYDDIIDNSYNIGLINIEADTSYCGGIVGDIIGGGAYGYDSTCLRKCYNEGNIDINARLQYTGGIMASNNLKKEWRYLNIYECYNLGNIIATYTNIDEYENCCFYIGGIAGYTYYLEELSNCYNEGTISEEVNERLI